MQAFAIQPDASDRTQEIDGEFEIRLPLARCDLCNRRCSCIHAEYPTIESLADLRFADEEVTVDEFRRLAMPLALRLGERGSLLPGAGAGTWIGEAQEKMSDVSWIMPWLPLFHRELVESINALGVEIHHGSAQVRCCGIVEDTHVVPKCGFASLLASVDWDRLQLTRCSNCGDVRSRSFKPMRKDMLCFLMERWPIDAKLVKPAECPGMILAAPDLAAVLLQLKPNGLALRPVGEFI